MEQKSVSIEETRVIKVYPSAEASDAALHRAQILPAAGLHTPPATRITPTALAFPRLTGRTGTPLAADLPALLAPLLTLHHIPVPGLAAQDPFRRIRPRLSRAPAPLRDRIHILENTPQPQPTGTIHGDFHPGQVIASEDGTAWLIDLDDLALGTPEADIGNLLAHLLTAPATRDAALQGGWRHALLKAWTGLEPDAATLCLQTEIALIRRALKRAERGDDAPLSRLMSDGYRAEITDG